MTPVDLSRSKDHSAGPWRKSIHGKAFIIEARDGENGSFILAELVSYSRRTEADGNLIEDAPLIRAELVRARERIAQLEAQAAWRPIADAPTVEDMTEFLLSAPKLGCFVGVFAMGYWRESATLMRPRIPPTHFRPLPAAPITTDAEGGENDG